MLRTVAPSTPDEELVKKIAGVILEIRQYLGDTEFAPLPFKSPVSIYTLKVIYPKRIIALCRGFYQTHEGKTIEGCYYCRANLSGPMLAMGKYLVHSDCVIEKLNQLLDPGYLGRGEPARIVGYLGD